MKPYNDRALLPHMETLRQRHHCLYVRGFPKLGDRLTVPSSWYIPPSLGSYIPQDAPESNLASDAGRYPLKVLMENPQMLLRGAKGGGKSALLSYYSRALATREDTPMKDAVGDLVPILISASRLEHVLPEQARWSHLLQQVGLEAEEYPYLGRGEFEGVVTPYLERGQVVLLVDDWSTATPEDRLWLGGALDELRARYPQVRLVVAVEGEGEGFGDLPSVWIHPLRKSIIQTYMTRWAEERGGCQWESLDPSARIQARNPAQLELICLAMRAFGVVPKDLSLIKELSGG